MKKKLDELGVKYDGETLAITSTSNSDTSIYSISATQAEDADATDDLYAFDLSLVNQSGDAGDTVTGLRIRVLNDAADLLLQKGYRIVGIDNFSRGYTAPLKLLKKKYGENWFRKIKL
jgi:hypothetical protein